MIYIPSVFEPVRKLLKWEKVAIDNFVFRLHYKVTLVLFLIFVVMVTAKQHFGDPIDCHMESTNPIQPKVMNSWCWLTGTYTNEFLSKDRERECVKEHSREVCHLGQFHPNLHRRVHHQYYQWVSWVIFFQALLFYLPRLLWKNLEGGKVKYITSGVDSTPSKDSKEEEDRAIRLQKGYNLYSGRLNSYALKFFCCEILNLVNVVLNLWMVNTFLHGRFTDYGTRIIKWWMYGSDDDPMGDVFPKASMCLFDRFASGGSKLKLQNLCILSLNIINDKVYFIMWIWLHSLLIATICNLMYRLIVLMVPLTRSYILWQGARGGRWTTIVAVATNLPIGDWFLLRQISKNVDEVSFMKLLENIEETKANHMEYNPSLLPWKPTFRRSKVSKGPDFMKYNTNTLMKTPETNVTYESELTILGPNDTKEQDDLMGFTDAVKDGVAADEHTDTLSPSNEQAAKNARGSIDSAVKLPFSNNGTDDPLLETKPENGQTVQETKTENGSNEEKIGSNGQMAEDVEEWKKTLPVDHRLAENDINQGMIR